MLEATRRLVTGLTNLTWITAGYGWFTLVAPLLVAAPLYFSGRLSFGGLMQAAAAFTTAQASLRWFVDNFRIIADWRATLLRVANFRRAVVTTDVIHEVESHITYAEGIAGRIAIEDLEVSSPAGCDLLRERAGGVARRRAACSSWASPEPTRRCCFARSRGSGRSAPGASSCPRASRFCISRAARPICRRARCARCLPTR